MTKPCYGWVRAVDGNLVSPAYAAKGSCELAQSMGGDCRACVSYGRWTKLRHVFETWGVLRAANSCLSFCWASSCTRTAMCAGDGSRLADQRIALYIHCDRRAKQTYKRDKNNIPPESNVMPVAIFETNHQNTSSINTVKFATLRPL